MTPTEIRDELRAMCVRLRALADSVDRQMPLADQVNQLWTVRASERVKAAHDAVQTAWVSVQVAYYIPDKEEADAES